MRFILIAILTALLFSPVLATQVIHTEIYPKPAKAGQVVYFRMEVFGETDTASPEGVQIIVTGKPLPVRFVDRLERGGGKADWFYTGIAPEDFDWRKVRIRFNGEDYPAGPDDPYMICDAPFRVKSATNSLPISVVFHDADNDDVQLQFVDVFNDATGQLVTSYPIWQWIADPYRSFLFDNLTAANFNSSAGDTAWVKVVLHCDDHDWPWIPEEYTFTQHLKVRVGRDLPTLPGWYYGDVHTHSRYTDNEYEYGGPLEMFAAAAQAVGLSFATISDHSSDFDASGSLWAEMAAACAQASTASVHLFPAEEVCLDDNEEDNSPDNRVHYLNYSNFFIRGPEAPITQCRDVSEQFTFLSQALTQMEEGGGFGYAAHPFQAFDPFQAWFGLAMMTWSVENYGMARASSAFGGLEIMNERNRYKKNVDYWYELNPFPWQDNPNWEPENTWITQGLAQWDAFLSSGLTQNLVTPALLPQRLYVSAGSDCHGDFNYRTYNADPIFYDVWATDNAFGNLRTAVFVPGYGPGQLPPLADLMAAYRLGRSVMTDGPLVEIGVDANGDGDLNDPGDLRIGDDGIVYSAQISAARLLVNWQSSEDWGTVQSLAVYRGTATTGSNPTVVWLSNPGNYGGQQSLPLADLVPNPSDGWIYLRAEALGSPLPDGARHAFTNPVWLRVDTTPTASISIHPQNLPVLIPANGGSFQYTISVTNQTTSSVNCNVWVQAILPNGNVYPILNTPGTLPAGITASRVRTQSVPASAPAGDYVYRANVGLYPTPWSSDGFMFSKMGSEIQDSGFGSWSLVAGDWPLVAGSDDPPLIKGGRGDLFTAQPNPFNATTAISYQLQAASHVSLKVYDISGRLVWTLVDGVEEVGDHQVIFDGSKLASGMYLYRLEAGSDRAMGKMLLLK